MKNINQTDAVALLKAIEDSCCGSSNGLPHKQEKGSEWSGIAFRVANASLVVALGEVVEILEFPDITFVPMTRPWVRGMANVRGSLLPVIDLNGYLNGSATKTTIRTRVLVIDHIDVFTGLVVDEVLGSSHFIHDEFVQNEFIVQEALKRDSQHSSQMRQMSRG